VASYVLRARLRPLDRFAIVAAAVSLAAVFKSADYFPHYSYFTAAFLGLLGGAALGSLLEAVQTMTAAAPSPSGGTSAGRSWTARVLAVALAPTLAVGVCIGGVIGYVRGESIVDRYPGVITVGDFGPGVAAAVPRGACVLTDEPALTITANRFVSSRPCPDVVDPFYVWLSEDPKRVPPAGPPYDPDLVAKWRDWLSQADYVVLSGYPFRIPWSGELGAWFRSNFEAVAEPGPVVYRRIDGQVP
jgi:hypothetical protein